MLKKILLALIFVITAITNVAHAEDDMKTVASKAYVDTKIETKQLKIPAAGQPNVDAGETVMTYTSTGNGQIGERGLYSDISSYDATTDGDKLITASALNATFTNLPTTPTTKLECANSPACTLWTIVDQTAYAYKLPDGYTRLQYIESTGTQYITLPAFPNVSNIEITADVLHTTGTNEQIFFGRDGVQSLYTTTVWRTWKSGVNNVSLGDVGTRHRFVIKTTSSGVEYYVDGVKNNNVSSSFYTSSSFAGKTFNLGARTKSDGTGDYLWNGKIYGFSVVGNGVLQRAFVPAKHGSVVGLYDTVTGAFLTNQGTGDFTPGPPVQ